MDSIHFESEHVPAPTLALTELLETFQKSPEFPKNKQDGNNTRLAFRLLAEFLPTADTGNFGAKEFKRYKYFLIDKKYECRFINKLLQFVKRTFDWAMTEELVTETRAVAIGKVPAVKTGEARMNEPRMDVPPEYLDEAVPHLPTQIADMLRLQLMTAMRPSELCRITRDQIHHNNVLRCLAYSPEQHKTKRKGHSRIIPLTAEAMEILDRYPTAKPEQPIFRNLERYKGQAISPSRYSTVICKAIKKHALPKFVPYQLRHTRVTSVSLEHGRDVARAFAGHSSEQTTRIYDHSDIHKIGRVVSQPARTALRIFKGE